MKIRRRASANTFHLGKAGLEAQGIHESRLYRVPESGRQLPLNASKKQDDEDNDHESDFSIGLFVKFEAFGMDKKASIDGG